MIADSQFNNQSPEPETKSDSPASVLAPAPAASTVSWIQDSVPWPTPVEPRTLLDELVQAISRHVVLPQWGPEALALWVLHTYLFHCRDITTYIGIESPESRCGKTTLLALLCQLVNRPAVASHFSAPALLHIIQEARPTLLLDEVNTLLRADPKLCGILNSGYQSKTGYAVRVASGAAGHDDSLSNRASRLARFPTWCPKILATVGSLPGTLSDRCVIIRMQRKRFSETCHDLEGFDGESLRQRCARIALDHADQIRLARPDIPRHLDDRAADIWKPLLALADLAGADWPEKARHAAVGLSAATRRRSSTGMLLMHIWSLFAAIEQDKIPSRTLISYFNTMDVKPWDEDSERPLTEISLARKLRPYGIGPRCIRSEEQVFKGYVQTDFEDAVRRYVSLVECEAFHAGGGNAAMKQFVDKQNPVIPSQNRVRPNFGWPKSPD